MPTDDQALARETFDVLGYRVEVGAPPGDAQAAVRAVLGGFGPVAPATGHVSHLDLTPAAAGEWHIRADDGIVESGNFPRALAVLEWHVVSAALERCEHLFHLHGAGLCLPAARAGLVLVGGSGRGKTTLTLGLMMRGFAPFADDVTLIDPGTLELRPLRRAFHVADETWRLLEPLAGSLARDTRGPLGYFLPPQWAETPVPVRWVLFPEYRPRQAPELVPMSAAEAATAILGQTLSLARAPRLALSLAARLTGEARSYRFLSGDLLESVEMVQRLVSASGSTPAPQSRG